MKNISKKEATKLIMEHEGLRIMPYKCTAGKLTIGYGRNIEECGINKREALMLLSNDIDRFSSELNRNVKDFQILSAPMQTVLLDMVFALGITKLLRFKKMLAAIDENNITKTIREMLDSRFARTHPRRMRDLVDKLKDSVSLKD
jgi:lysozyme